MFWLLFLPLCLGLQTQEPPPPARLTRNDPVEGWVNIRLNHFQAYGNETFAMRYYYNSEHVNSSDLVIFVGGEWSISPGWVTGGLAYEVAEELQAGLIYTEHRYYGQTRPTATTTTEELRFLTIDQALGDLVEFIHYARSDNFEGGQFKDGKVVLVGCSYAGTMATWMRLAYPHVVQAAFSDSGPLHAQEDFPEYLETITLALREEGGQACVDSVRESVEQTQALLGSAAGAVTVSNLFGTCSTIQWTVPLDVATFFWFGITESFAYLVQYATPGDIPAACNVLTNETTIADPVERLASWVTSQSWFTNNSCLETRYTEVVAAHTNTSYDAPDSVMRLWTYQTCVEFGWYQSTSGSQQVFASTVPLEYFHQMCLDFFGNSFTQTFLNSGIHRTNTLFGGLTSLPDRTVTVQGGHDPWSPMGPTGDHGRELAPVYIVPEVSHCRAIRSLNDNDSEELSVVKRAVFTRLVSWTTGVSVTDSAAFHTSSVAMVMLLCTLLFVY